MSQTTSTRPEILVNNPTHTSQDESHDTPNSLSHSLWDEALSYPDIENYTELEIEQNWTTDERIRPLMIERLLNSTDYLELTNGIPLLPEERTHWIYLTDLERKQLLNERLRKTMRTRPNQRLNWDLGKMRTTLDLDGPLCLALLDEADKIIRKQRPFTNQNEKQYYVSEREERRQAEETRKDFDRTMAYLRARYLNPTIPVYDVAERNHEYARGMENSDIWRPGPTGCTIKHDNIPIELNETQDDIMRQIRYYTKEPTELGVNYTYDSMMETNDTGIITGSTNVMNRYTYAPEHSNAQGRMQFNGPCHGVSGVLSLNPPVTPIGDWFLANCKVTGDSVIISGCPDTETKRLSDDRANLKRLMESEWELNKNHLSRQWFEYWSCYDHKVGQPHHRNYCEVNDCPLKRHIVNGVMDDYFIGLLNDVLMQAEFALRQSHTMNLRDIVAVEHRIRSHPVVILAHERVNFYQHMDEDKELYLVFRTLRLFNRVFGDSMPNWTQFYEQAEEQEGYFTKFTGIVQQVFDSFKNMLSKPTTTVVSILKTALGKVMGAVSSLVIFAGEQAMNAITWISSKISSLITGIFGTLSDAIGQVASTTKLLTVATAGVAISLLILVVGGMLTLVNYKKIIQMITGKHIETPETENNFVEQGNSTQPAAYALAVAAAVCGLASGQSKMVSTVLGRINTLVTGSAAVLGIAGLVFTLMPEALSMALMHKFAPKTYIKKYYCNQWIAYATCLVSMSRIQKAIGSTKYLELITKCYEDGVLLLEQIGPDNQQKGILATLMMKMLSTREALEAYFKGKSKRSVPFCIHLFGEAGIGKSTIMNRLIYDVTGIVDTLDEPQYYTRGLTDEFWSGFMNQPVIKFDEFLNVPLEKAAAHGGDYLGLVSSEEYMPNMAAMETNSSGAGKGARVTPKFVITANNNPFFQVEGLDTNALNRRRAFNIRMVLAKHPTEPNRYRIENGNVVFKHLDDDEIKNVKWARFQFFPRMPREDWNTVKPVEISYVHLIAILRQSYVEHNELFERLTNAINNTTTVRSSEDFIMDTLKTELGMPTEPVSVTTAVMELFSSEKTLGKPLFFEQGRGRPKGKVPSAQQPINRKNPDAGLDIVKSIMDCVRATKVDFLKIVKNDPQELQYTIDDWKKEGIEKFAINMAFDMKTVSDAESFVPLTDKELDGYQQRLEKLYLDLDTCSEYESSDEGTSIERIRRGHERKFEAQGAKSQIEQAMDALDSIDGDDVQPYTSDDESEYDSHERIVKKVIEQPSQTWAQWLQIVPLEIFAKTIKAMGFGCGCCTSPMDNFKVAGKWCVIIASVAYFSKKLFDMWRQPGEEKPETLTEQSPTSSTVSSGRSYLRYQRRGGGWDSEGRARSHASSGSSLGSMIAHGGYNPAEKGITLQFPRLGTTMRGIQIGDRDILTYSHGLVRKGDRVKAGDMMMVTDLNGKMYEEIITEKTIDLIPEFDCAVVRVTNRQMPCAKSMKKDFLSEDEFQKLTPWFNGLTCGNIPKVGKVRIEHNLHYSGESEIQRTLGRYGRMKTSGMVGDCGTLVKIHSGPFSGRYLGIHVAGTMHDATADPEIAVSIITREMIQDMQESLDNNKGYDAIDSVKEKSFIEQGPEEFDFEAIRRNAREFKLLDNTEKIFLNRTTKLKHSPVFHNIGLTTDKEPAVLSWNDPRGCGVDPVVKGVFDTLDTEHPKVDEKLVRSVYKTMENVFDKNLDWSNLKRQLSFVEACKGVPGELCSLRLSTSAGWPYCKISTTKGKRSFLNIDEKGTLYVVPWLEEEVDKFLNKCEYADPSIWEEHRFLGYLKDELVSKKKVAENRTRLIYANDMVAMIAFRMRLGALLAAFNRSYSTTSSAIGVNQYSHDLQTCFDYMATKGLRFVAGDYKSFDKRCHPVFREHSYRLLMNLAQTNLGVSEAFCHSFVQHETRSAAQIDNLYFKTESNHMSGCFFTTIINNLVNEGYMRYCFAREFPEELYDDHVRGKFLGDDHVLSVSDKCDFSPSVIQNRMKELGQTYTDDTKSLDSICGFRNFEDITFLGAHPKVIEGRYCGALRKDSIEDMLLWMRSDESFHSNCHTAQQYASAWGPEYYDELQNKLCNALLQEGMDPAEYILVQSADEMSRALAHRVAAKGFLFWEQSEIPTYDQMRPKFFEQGGGDVRGLTTFYDTREVTHDQESTQLRVLDDTMATDRADLMFGLESYVRRQSLFWTKAQTVGTILGSWKAPFGILSIGNQNNVQNYTFDHWLWWAGDPSLRIQVNGQPFQQGLLALYWYPLSDQGDRLERENWPGQPIAWISPNNSTTAEQTVGFLYSRSAVNTFAASLMDERQDIGMFSLGVMEPLVDNTSSNSVEVTVYSAFKNNQIPQIPRARLLAGELRASELAEYFKTSPLNGVEVRYYKDGKELEHLKEVFPNGPEVPMVEQGNVTSSVTNNENITVEHVGGSMPVQGPNLVSTPRQDVSPTSTVAAGQGVSASNGGSGNKRQGPMEKLGASVGGVVDAFKGARAKNDNPPLASGGVPVYQQFSGMSKSIGVEPCVALDLAPSRQTHYMEKNMIDNATVSFISSRRGLLKTLSIDVSDTGGTRVGVVELDSMLGMGRQFLVDETSPPTAIACLWAMNLGMFWKADICFELRAVKTAYHSMRLGATVGYAVPPNANLNDAGYFNHVMDFDATQDVHTFRVNWNQTLSKLRTFEGLSVTDPVQDYSLGTLSFDVRNVLKASSTIVSQGIKILVFAWFENVEIPGVPRPYPFINSNEGSYGDAVLEAGNALPPPPLVNVSKEICPDKEFVEQGGEGLGTPSMAANDEIEPEVEQDTTNNQINTTPNPVCRLTEGHLFEYHLNHLSEYWRRFVRLPQPKLQRLNGLDLDDINGSVFVVEVEPVTPVTKFFAGWSGSMLYRIFMETQIVVDNPNFTTSGMVTFIPFNKKNPIGQGLDTGDYYYPIIDEQRKQEVAGGLTVTMATKGPTMAPRERIYYQSAQGQITVLVKHDNNYLFMQNPGGDGAITLAPTKLGDLLINSPGVKPPEIWIKPGDDFRLWCYRTPIGLKIRPYNVAGGNPLNLSYRVNIGGWFTGPLT